MNVVRIRNIKMVRRTRWQRYKAAPGLFLAHFRAGKCLSLLPRLWVSFRFMLLFVGDR